MLLAKNKFQLRKQKNFFSQAKKKETYFFRLYYLFNQHLQTSRLAVIVPKKKVKQAVLRNKIKRWLKGTLTRWLKEQERPASVYLVVYLKRNFLVNQQTKQALKELLWLLNQPQVYKNKP